MQQNRRTAKATKAEKDTLEEFRTYVEAVKSETDRAISNIPSYTLAVQPNLMDLLIDVLRNPKRYV